MTSSWPDWWRASVSWGWRWKHSSAIRLDRYRTEKKDANEEVWQVLRVTPQYQAGQAVRY